MPLASPPLIQAIDLCFSRNEERIFGPVNFHVSQGEALLVKGENGAGKTTLLRVLAGLLASESGGIQLNGQVFSQDSFVAMAAYVGHKHGHKAELTTLQNLLFSARLRGQHKTAMLEQVIAECGLAGYEDTPAGKLSAGQNKRLSLARLTMQACPLWLLDEPYANLDLSGIAWVNTLIQTHVDAGGGVLISTHGAYASPKVPVRELQLFRGTVNA